MIKTIFSVIYFLIKLLSKHIIKFFIMETISENENQTEQGNNEKMDWDFCDDARSTSYTFRPYEIVKINYCGDIRNSEYPSPRSGHRVVCSNSNLYCLGGFNLTHVNRGNISRLLFRELWEYNFVTRRWTKKMDHKVKDMPEELASNAVTIHDDVLIAYGGTGYPFGQACSNNTHFFSIKKPFVKRLKVSGDLPTPMYGPAIVVHDRWLYTIGGTTGYDYSCDVYRLDLYTKTWEMLYICQPDRREDDPKGRYRHEIVYDGTHIYVLGGGTSITAYSLKEIPAFNLKTNTWDMFKTKPDVTLKVNGGYPESRKCYSCIQYKTEKGIEAVIAGGYTENDNAFSDIWKLTFSNMEWKLIRTAKLPNPLYFHSASTSGNGCMYLFGGIELVNDLSRTNDLFKMWTTIPKLSEMCWDAITYYNPNLDRYTEGDLLSIGIPKKFVERVPVAQKYSPSSSSVRKNNIFNLYSCFQID
ncbi:kelch domain-containing protein 10 homolog [Condylostylus longicornis]|uniref:kelch domain-containing protein 10 homolog n=1 Tax=Condylostylus longicornis TaxID=2530218 RepID=UPI00244E4D57|nr:kelch domain-containing protein 10 homolog [Condylostylus longicornis]